MEIINVIVSEMFKGNFSFAILVVGIIQSVLMINNNIDMNKNRDSK